MPDLYHKEHWKLVENSIRAQVFQWTYEMKRKVNQASVSKWKKKLKNYAIKIIVISKSLISKIPVERYIVTIHWEEFIILVVYCENIW